MVERLSPTVSMFVAYRSAENRVFADLRAAGFDDLTLQQARVVARLAPDGIRLTDLAEQTQVTKQTATHLVDQLERSGYVRRVPDPADGRGRLVQIADRGRLALEVAAAADRAIVREWTAHLGADRMREFRKSLAMLREITDPYQ
ncbi:MarR family winged helix-turn-helix transcriptional regulator [Nocardia stercoris]|uniref:MarR family transcriptional regulator n=1 Tax=Nocardia stercoris TaxID=2483361 RepID=A0A3M2LA31_9NOCA|nr:MarR family transcriptional regulator [Nocardia stercoris]RMI34427.1 MarR family transcriptional regulator [Nocardia stercoris]